MKVISIANIKGGCGKTTSAALLCSGLHAQGHRVGLIDCDALSPLFDWSREAGLRSAKAVQASRPNDLMKHIGELQPQVDYLLVDLSGSSEIMNAIAFAMSDLVLIPMQASAIDARGAKRTIGLMQRVMENQRSLVAACLVLTRITSPMVRNALRHSTQITEDFGVPLLSSPILERTAFRDMFSIRTDLMSSEEESLCYLSQAREDIHSLTSAVALHLQRKGA